MDNKEAIYYLQYLRHYVLANSPYDVAIVAAINALSETAPPKSNADRIRQMTDDEELLSAIGTGCYRCAYNNGECGSKYGEGCGCIEGNLEWLKQDVSKDAGTDWQSETA